MFGKNEKWEIVEERITTYPPLDSRTLKSNSSYINTSRVPDIYGDLNSQKYATIALHDYADSIEEVTNNRYESLHKNGKIVRVVDTTNLIVLVLVETGLFSRVVETIKLIIKKVS